MRDKEIEKRVEEKIEDEFGHIIKKVTVDRTFVHVYWGTNIGSSMVKALENEFGNVSIRTGGVHGGIQVYFLKSNIEGVKT